MAALEVPSSLDPREGERFVRALDRRLGVLDRAIVVADWQLFTGRARAGSERAQLRRTRFLSDERILRWVRRALERSWAPDQQRRLELLERVLLDTQVEQAEEVVRLRSDLQRRIVGFRPRWKGRRVNRQVVAQALREGRAGSDRRRAYYALDELHRPMEDRFRALVALRSERARGLGYRSFAELRLGFQGLSPSRLEELVDDVSRLVRGPLQRLRSEFLDATGASDWFPWDFSYALQRRASLPRRAFPRARMLAEVLDAIGQWGFRTDRFRFRTVFHDCPSGGLTLAPDPPRDVRILVHPAGGWLSYMILFHEAGHAVHSASIRAPRHLLRWHENVPGFGAFHEGVAGLFEEIASQAAWLASRPGVPRERAQAFDAANRGSAAYWAAWNASWLRSEQALYRDPARDPMPECCRFDRRLFGFGESEPLSFVDPFFVDDPIYAPNYLLSILFGRQLREALEEQVGGPYWPNPRAGPWLIRNWFVDGSRFDWVPRVREVTGRPFGTRAFAGYVRSSQP